MATKAWLVLLAMLLPVAGCATAATPSPLVVPTAAGTVLGVTPARDGQAARRAGPLNAADRDLLVKVRLAGLWEMPAGRQAEERAASQRVKEVGSLIMNEHATLDEAVRATATQLGVELPDQPNADQQRWLGELNAASGAQWDQIFANRLRAAHGAVFSVIAQVRAGTRNSVMRSFADTTNRAVLRHMGYLESTGLVDHEALPEAPPPAPAKTAAAAAAAVAPEGLSGADVLIVLLLSMIAVVITLGLLWVGRNRPPRGGHRRRRPNDPLGELFADRP